MEVQVQKFKVQGHASSTIVCTPVTPELLNSLS